MNDPKSAEPPPIDTTKLAIEFGPLLVFFLANYLGKKYVGADSIYWATGAFMVSTIVAMVASQIKYTSIAPMLWVNGIIVTLFGGLTIALHDERFIKVKPTIVNSLFGIVLIGGLVMKKNLLKIVLESGFPPLSDAVWRTLTIRWALFFFFLAGLNEFVWRSFSTDFWVNFKVWGIMPITLLFTASQLPLILKQDPDTGK
jgi:intracellular septation protein